MADTTKNPFGLTGDIRNVLSEINRKMNHARHLIHNTRVALAATDVKIGDGPDELPRERLAKNLEEALAMLDEITN